MIGRNPRLIAFGVAALCIVATQTNAQAQNFDPGCSSSFSQTQSFYAPAYTYQAVPITSGYSATPTYSNWNTYQSQVRGYQGGAYYNSVPQAWSSAQRVPAFAQPIQPQAMPFVPATFSPATSFSPTCFGGS